MKSKKNAKKYAQLNIGVDKEAVLIARKTVFDILDRHLVELTKQEALRTLRTICEVKNVTVSRNTFG